MCIFLFSSLLESICYKFYDTMRPVVIHVNHLETLAELSSILKVSFTFATVHNDVSVVMTQSNHH